MDRGRSWAEDHPDVVPLLKRCWDGDDRRKSRTVDPADAAALADWVTRTVLASPYATPFDDWPIRFVHRRAHRDLSDLFPI